MYLSDHAEAQRLDRITSRARTDRVIQPRLTAVAQAAPMESATVEEERRFVPRGKVRGDILVRRLGSFGFNVPIANVSIGGCEVELIDGYEVGDSLVARFAQLEPLGARVCWTEGRRAGIEFSKMIHPAVLHALVRRMAPAAD